MPMIQAWGVSESILPAAVSGSLPLGYQPVPTRGKQGDRLPHQHFHDGDGASLGMSAWWARAEPGGQAPGEEACGDVASCWTIPGESHCGGTMPPKEWLPLAATAWVMGSTGGPGELLCRRWRHGGSADPAALLRGRRHTEPVLSLAPRRQPGPQHLAAARVPGQRQGCGSGRAAGRGKSAFPLFLAPGERGSFFIQGFADWAFQLPLEPQLLCHRVGDKGCPKKKKSKLRLEGWALQQ